MIKPTPASTLLALSLVALWLLGRHLGLSAEELLAAIAAIVGIVGGALHRAKPPSRGGGPGPSGRVVPFMLLCLPSCAGTFEEARLARVGAASPPARCASLDDQRRHWGAAAKGSGVVAGGLGAVAGVVPDLSAEARVGFAGGALAAGALAAVAVVEAEGAAQSWARECTP